MTPSLEKNAPSAKAKSDVKKRTLYKQKSMLEFPDWAKSDSTHKYRWVSKRRLSRSDGFDPRGWSIAKDPVRNESLEAFDLVLHRMPLDEWEAMKEYKHNAARDNVQHVLESIESQQDRLKYELDRLGARISKTEFTIERKA
jgi:hypothetical protein